MIYNKEELLTMLDKAPIYLGGTFDETDIDNFYYEMGDDFSEFYDCASGASKLALIPKNKNKDFVIKIPFTGCYYGSNSDYGYTYEDEDGYCHFSCSACEEREWDYCGCEAERFIKAKEAGFARCFAETRFIGFVHGYPVYVQERAETLQSTFKTRSCSRDEKELEKTSKKCHDFNYYNISLGWLTDFRLYFGEEMFEKFISFIDENEWDDDLSSNNIGYIGDRPVLIDYSGFWD